MDFKSILAPVLGTLSRTFDSRFSPSQPLQNKGGLSSVLDMAQSAIAPQGETSVPRDSNVNISIAPRRGFSDGERNQSDGMLGNARNRAREMGRRLMGNRFNRKREVVRGRIGVPANRRPM